MKTNINTQGLWTQRLLTKKLDIRNNGENFYEEKYFSSKAESLQNAVL